jgi:hypothetical protein
VLVRERAMAGWIDETQGKIKGCGVKEGSDRNHVVFCPQLPVRCCVFVSRMCLCLSRRRPKQPHVTRHK